MNGRSQEDSELVSRSRIGDRDAYALLIEKHQRPLFTLVYARVGNYDEAMDLVHHAFVEGYLGMSRLRDASRPGAWFFGIAQNLIRKRRRGMFRSVPLETVGDTLPARDAEEEHQLLDQIWSAIRELPSELRDVLLLHYTQHLSYEQIASILGIPWGTVQDRLARGRAVLRGKLVRLRNQS